MFRLSVDRSAGFQYAWTSEINCELFHSSIDHQQLRLQAQVTGELDSTGGHSSPARCSLGAVVGSASIMIEVSLLGPLRVRREGVNVTPSAPKLRRVFALLALNANSLVSVDQLFDELWEDRLPYSALTTLQTYIYQLRRRLQLTSEPGTAPHLGPHPALTPPKLLTRISGYELRLAVGHPVDVRDFDLLATQGRTEIKSGHLEQGVNSLRKALSLWRGQPLVDIGAGRRLSPWVSQLKERHIGNLELRFTTELELGDHRAVLDELVGTQREHPLHEGFASHLMIAFHRCDRRADALDVFRTIRGQLVEELGLEPSAHLQRLHQAILADDPELLRMRRSGLRHCRRSTEDGGSLT
jgi:DNA-binding SARP family transcriptional activator